MVLGLGLRIARILGETKGEKSPRELVPMPLAAICALFLLVLLPMPHLFAGLRKDMQPQKLRCPRSLLHRCLLPHQRR